MKNKYITYFILFFIFMAVHSYGYGPVLNEKHLKIQEMYQEQYLEPGFLGEYINWGYWEKSNPQSITTIERIEASKELYRQVFKAAQISKEDVILEIGCGKGRGIELLSKEYDPQEIVGIDLNTRFISIAKQTNSEEHISFVNGDACNFQFDEKFSKLISVEAIQHFLDLDGFIVSANKSLKKQGRIVVAGFFTKQDGDLEYLKHNIATVQNDIDIVRNIHELKETLLDNGFANIQITSIGNHVIPQYEEWLKQVSYENMWAKEWATAFEKGFIDYYIITADKL